MRNSLFFTTHLKLVSYQSIIEEIVCKNLELGTAHVIDMPLPQLKTFCNPHQLESRIPYLSNQIRILVFYIFT